MTIKFNIPFYPKSIKKNINLVLKSNKLTDGKLRDLAEKKLEKLLSSKKIFFTQSCTSALEACISICNIGYGDEVIVPSYTFTSSANSILLNSAKPVFADVDLNTLNLDPKDVEKKITKKTKAILVVHYNGYSDNIDQLLKLKKKYNLYLIEDCAHSIYSKYKNKFLGTIGDLGAFSFHETKNFPAGQGGALSVNNSKLFKRATIYCDKGTDRSFKGKKGYYSWKGMGSEIRATEITSAIIYSQILSLRKIKFKRKQIWDLYKNFLENLNQNLFFLPKYNFNNSEFSYHIFPVIFFKKSLRLKFEKYMLKEGIECFFHYYPLHLSSFGKKFSKIKLKNTEQIYDGLTRLPLYPSLSISQVKKILIKIFNFVKLYDRK